LTEREGAPTARTSVHLAKARDAPRIEGMILGTSEVDTTVSETHGQLPDFDNPPVIEVVCGVQFDEVEPYHATTFGSFWQLVRDEYPKVEDKAPLPTVFERPALVPQTIRAEIADSPPFPRVFLVGKPPNWLIQLQRNRFLHNWRKVNDDDAYPRYPAVFQRFEAAWQLFTSFWAEAEMGELRVNQLEITYINHIAVGDGWRDLGEIGHVFRDIEWKDGSRFLPRPESMGFGMTFLLPEKQGRLNVSVKQGLRQRDRAAVLVCELTARGMPSTTGIADLKTWFDMGREWIVKGFTDLTADRAHRHWGMKAR